MLRRLKSPYFAVFLSSILLLVSLGSASAQSVAPQVGWQYALTDGAVYGRALSADGSDLAVVIGYGFDPGGTIVSLDPATGDERWRVDIEEAPSSNPIIEDGVVYAGIGSLVSGRSAVYALDAASGAERWRADISNSLLPATPVDGVALGGGRLYVNRGDGVVLALDAATGEQRWEVQLPKPQRGTPVYDDERVFIATGFDGAAIYALDAGTGETVWTVEGPQNPATGVAVQDGTVYVPYDGGDLVVYDATTGDERWRAETGFRTADDPTPPSPGLPLVDDGTVYVTSNGFSGSATEAFDAATGAQQWIAPVGDFSGSAPALANGVVLVGSDSGELLGLDPTTGAERWRANVPGKVHIDLNQESPPLIGNGWIFLGDNEGGFVGLEWAA